MSTTPGGFSVANADIAVAQIFPALINRLEVRFGGENASQFQDVGLIKGGELTITPRKTTAAGGLPIQLGYEVAFKGSILATGTNMRTAMDNVIGNAVEFRLTDVSGHKWTFAGPQPGTSQGEISFTIGEEVKGDYEDARYFTMEGHGYLTKTRFTACFTTT